MSDFEPDAELEKQVLCGLLCQLDFLKIFVERGISPNIFLSKDSKAYRFIAHHVLKYYRKYQKLIDANDLLEEVEKRCENDEATATSKKRYYTKLLRGIYKCQVPSDVIVFRLDKLIELYKNYQILVEGKELKRYYECEFDYKKHDLCKGCPVWKNCKMLQASNKPFPDKVISMLQMRMDGVLEASGSKTSESEEVIGALEGELENYEQRAQAREEGGDDFTFGIPTPWPTATRILDGWQPNCLYGICAAKKTGKTTVLLNVADAALRAGKNVLFFHMEDNPQQFRRKFLAMMAAIPHDDIRHARLEVDDYEMAKRRYKEYKDSQKDGVLGKLYTYYRPIKNIGLHDVQSVIESYRGRGVKIDLVIFDHLHIADLSKLPRTMSKPEKYVFISESFKTFCQFYNLTMIFAGQLKTSGDRKGELRWSDEVEDSVDGMFHILEHKDQMKLVSKVGRFEPFWFYLDNHRDKVLLPEAEDRSDEDEDLWDANGELVVPSEDYLGVKTSGGEA